MFTGIIRQVAEVQRAERSGDLMRLRIAIGEMSKQIGIGDSVSVDGACLTATSASGDSVQFDVGEETLRVTTLGEFRPGRRVNIELPVRADALLGGHIVQGHVDAVGAVIRVESGAGGATLEISVPPAIAAQMVIKGSVAVDGVSLTISGLGADSFEVYLIPHTLKSTTLGEKNVGDRVNVECDIIGKYVAKALAVPRSAADAPSAGVTDRLLEEHGFK